MVEVSIVKCNSYSHAEPAVRKSIELVGGIKNFVKPKDKVLLKVNLLLPALPKRAITTHPKIVEAMIKIVHEAGGEPWIGDSSGGRGLTESALKVTGIQRVAEEHGAKIMNLDKTGVYKIEIPNGEILKEIQIAKPVFDADCVVCMPKLKTHALTLYTGAIKNMFGTVPGGKKSLIHSITGSSADKFAEAIIDIYSVLPVHLNLMDGIVGMEGLGPNHGKPKQSNVVLASSDSVAMDSVASAIMGYSPNQIPTLRIAKERALGTIDLNEITIKGERIEAVKTEFKKPVRIYKGLMFLPASVRNFFVETPRLPFPNPKGCNRCKICEKACPVSAISVTDAPNFDYEKCIRCYCCYELCPENGIKLKKSLLR
jgi:uncharacterized protein (DUF362 family)/NAD-dependent dihydropyrimidine dehydrogenase PreA subunit